jgi:SAM-dependent methyltransferase
MSAVPEVPGPAYYDASALAAYAGGAHAEYLDGTRGLRPRLARSLALAGLRPGLEVVDLGAGRGEATAHAARRGARVTALDFSPGSLGLTRETVRRRAGVPVRLLAAEAGALPLPTASVDRVLFLDVLEHLGRAQAADALAEIARILRPTGYAVIHTLPNRWALACAYPILRLAWPQLPAQPRSAYERAVHVNEQSLWSLRRALGAAGLAHEVWVEEWSTRQAVWGSGLAYPDRTRRLGYTMLARPAARRCARLAMTSPLRWWVGNDLFALAWPAHAGGPPPLKCLRPVR